MYGARPLKRAIQQQVENPLSKALLAGEFATHDTVRVETANNALAFTKKATPAEAAG